MSNTPPLFSCRNISFRYPQAEAPVLDNVSFELHAGDRIGITGKNGSGKSTLLHIGAGLLRPPAGEVLYNGVACVAEQDFVQARKQLGYLLQKSADQLFCTTVLEDVAFGPYNLGLTMEEAEAKAWTVLRDLSLEHLADRNGQRLSGGEQKMAALASILVMDVAFLFLDEPTSSLDPSTRERLPDILSRYGLPAVVISHSSNFLQTVCTRFLTLENGKLTLSPT